MATVVQMISRIKRRLSRKNDPNIEVDILDELAAAQELLEGRPTLPDILATAFNPTIVGAHDQFILTQVLNDPLFQYIRLQERGIWVWNPASSADAEYTRIVKEDYDTLISRDLGTGDSSAIPTHYAQVGKTIYIRPKMSVSRTYQIFFYRKDPYIPATTGNGNTNFWATDFSNLLAATAGIKISRLLRDTEALKIFTMERNEALVDFLKSQSASQDAAAEYVMGDD